jgi:hypothetical protein
VRWPGSGRRKGNNSQIHMTKPPIAILVPDGISVRNFILGKFLCEMAQRFRLHVFHNIPEALLPRYQSGAPDGVEWYELVPYEQKRLATVLKSTLEYAHMYHANTHAMRRAFARPIGGSAKARLFVHSSRLLGRAGAVLGGIDTLEDLHCRTVAASPETERYREILARIQPEILFSCSQRPGLVLPAVLAAQAMGIPTAAFVFSWDHLTTKGRIAAPFDQYLVWSEHMGKELTRYYPQVLWDDIHIVGTPQFDPYADASLLWTREEFCRRIGADPARKLVCYSGGDTSTCPEDPLHLEALIRHVRSGSIRGNPEVLLRPVPVDSGARYEDVCRRYPEIRHLRPQWIHAVPGDWRRVLPTQEDVQFLSNLTHHVDVNVNLGSTMTLDFGLHDRPVVNVAFDCADPPIFGMPVWDYYYNYEHLRPIVELGASRIARTREQLADQVNAYLENPALDRQGRRRLADLQVGIPPGESSTCIAETLDRMRAKDARTPGPSHATYS